MHNPLRIAEEFAMVDLLSNGRVILGAGRGMHPTEYKVFSADWESAQQRLPEALDIVIRAWTGGEFEWAGKHYSFPKISVYPKPMQKPHPPIYVTANKDPESFQMIGRRGHHLMTLPWIATNEVQRPRVEQYWNALGEAGHSVGEKAEARAEVLDHWNRWRGFALSALNLDPNGEAYRRVFAHLDYDAMTRDSRGVFGGPETCAKIVNRIAEVVGATHIGLTFHFGGLSQEKVIKSMERFARQVRPTLR
jgi:alkanesulfonate monooxygenase SsuD/methylene tetrahydromethanopterin reductase-like flavin-dependent oxidoreductase (luciferase family)